MNNFDNTLDFHQSGAKVWRNNEISKETGGTGQNLICNALSVGSVGCFTQTNNVRRIDHENEVWLRNLNDPLIVNSA